jgi:hypothetical protein
MSSNWNIAYNNIPKSIFLIFLAISGNFLAQTLNCRFQKALTDNMVLKFITVFIMIYFTLSLTSDYSPGVALFVSLAVFIGFMMLVRTHLPITITIIFLLMVIFTLNNYINYYDNLMNNESNPTLVIKYTNLIQQFQKAKFIIEIVTGIILVIGYIIYMMDKYQEYKIEKSGFSFLNFTFGRIECRSITGTNKKY